MANESGRQYPAQIPRDRAVAALDLANAILDYEGDSEPADPTGECDVEVSAAAWKRWRELAALAAEAL